MPRSQKEALINTINHLIKNEYEDVQQSYRWALVPVSLGILILISLSRIDIVLGLGGGLVSCVAMIPCSKADEHRGKARNLEAALPIVYTLDQPEEIKDLLDKFLKKTITI